jgi:hypothetical protein
MLTLLPPQHSDPATYMLTLIVRLPLKLFPVPIVTQSELGSPRKKPYWYAGEGSWWTFDEEE